MGVWREEDKPPYRHFGVAVVTWGSYVCTRHLDIVYIPCRRDVHGAMAAVSGHGSPTGALQRCHSLNCDITGSTKCPAEKQTS